MSAVEDRFCMMTNGKIHAKLSAQSALSCDSAHNYGCKGGAVSTVFDLGRKDGFVDETCLKYEGTTDLPCPTNIN